jgi:hypothetical protein
MGCVVNEVFEPYSLLTRSVRFVLCVRSTRSPKLILIESLVTMYLLDVCVAQEIMRLQGVRINCSYVLWSTYLIISPCLVPVVFR